MIFDVLKQRWLRKEFEKLEKNQRERLTKKPESLIVVFHADLVNSYSFFENWYSKLEISSSNCTLIAFTESLKEKKMDNVLLFDKKLLKWNGGVSDEKVTSILAGSYDLQINYLETSNDSLNYLIRQLNSKLKVGYAHHEENTYDLAINVPLTNDTLFISEIAKYLKILTQ